jgi:hypothetical protein
MYKYVSGEERAAELDRSNLYVFCGPAGEWRYLTEDLFTAPLTDRGVGGWVGGGIRSAVRFQVRPWWKGQSGENLGCDALHRSDLR